jgi:hypothetical protein
MFKMMRKYFDGLWASIYCEPEEAGETELNDKENQENHRQNIK